jgi:hypothetical protein
MTYADHGQFLDHLEACERISALLLLALESGTPDPLRILDQRKTLLDDLVALLPADLDRTELARLDALLQSGEQARARLLKARMQATSNLAALQQSLRLAQQLTPPRTPRAHQLEIKG